SRRRHTICLSDWSSDVCSSDLPLMRDGPGARRVLVSRAGSSARVGETPQCLLPSPKGGGTGVDVRGASLLSDTHETGTNRTVFRSEERRVGKEGRYMVEECECR